MSIVFLLLLLLQQLIKGLTSVQKLSANLSSILVSQSAQPLPGGRASISELFVFGLNSAAEGVQNGHLEWASSFHAQAQQPAARVNHVALKFRKPWKCGCRLPLPIEAARCTCHKSETKQ